MNLPIFMQILYTASAVCYAFLMELVTCFKIHQFSTQYKGDEYSASIYLPSAVLATPSKINLFRSCYLSGNRNCQIFFLTIFVARALVDLGLPRTDSQNNWGWKRETSGVNQSILLKAEITPKLSKVAQGLAQIIWRPQTQNSLPWGTAQKQRWNYATGEKHKYFIFLHIHSPLHPCLA